MRINRNTDQLWRLPMDS